MINVKRAILAFVASFVVMTPLAHAQLGTSDGPIEITADSFVLDDLKHEAIYTGNVDVIQGESRIRAQEVIVSYWSREDQQKRKEELGPAGASALKDIRAEGDVYYITPVERVKAERGIYSAEKERITLSGNVLVTNADGVLAGSHLVIDIPRGRYNMDGGEQGRVRTVIENVDASPIQ